MTTIDGVTIWLRHLGLRIAHTLGMLTVVERAGVSIAGLNAGLLVAVAVAHNDVTHWSILAGFLCVAGLLFAIVMDAAVVRVDSKRQGAAMIKLNITKPTGAPRVAEVSCRHGDPHRFVYGVTGWEPAGPAVNNRPTPEEAPAP
jgi:hypothetical protein